MKLIVTHGAKKIPIEISQHQTLEQLKAAIANASGIAPSQQKLLAGGAQLRNNDKAKLSQFGMLKDGSKLMVMEIPTAVAQPPPRTTSLPSTPPQPEADIPNGQLNSSETKLVQRIHQTVEKATNLIPSIDAFEDEIRGKKPISLVGHKTLEMHYIDEHARISEQLLQLLLDLDNVECEPEQETARNQRRSAVKLLQSFMDRADNVKLLAMKAVGKM